MTPEQREEFVSALSPREVEALEDMLPPTKAEHADADSPIALGRRLHPGWRDRDHLSYASDVFVRACERGDWLIVNMPSQTGKSSLLARWGPTWYLNRWPGRRVLMVSYAQALIRARSREVRDTFATHDLNTSIKKGRATQTEWETTDGGVMIASGIGGTITGHGADLLIIDDPFANFEEASSPAAREKVWSWWRAVGRQRISPRATVCVVQTRWHSDDLAGRLLSDEHEGDPSDWTVLRIPAIAEESDPIGRDPGEPLYRPDVNLSRVDQIAFWEDMATDLGEYLWHCMGQQRPGDPEGTIFVKSWWPYYRTEDGSPPRPGTTLILAVGTRVPVDKMAQYGSWDMSFKKTTSSSWVVGQVWGVHPDHPAYRFLLAQTRDRLGFSATKKGVRRQSEAWPDLRQVWVEDKANGPAVIEELRDEVSGITPWTPTNSKVGRAWSVQGRVQAGQVWLPSPAICPWVRGYVDELATFPTGQFDDQVDATTQFLRATRDKAPAEVNVPRGSRRERIGSSLTVTSRQIRR